MVFSSSKTQLFLIYVLNVLHAFAYKPVVIVHGIWDEKSSLNFLADRIRFLHPDTNVTIVDLLHGISSLAPMWRQVAAFGKVVQQINADHPDGIHLIGYSQGGLVCRGIVEAIPGLNISTFVSLSSPQGGQYGDSFLRLIFSKLVKETVYRVFYTGAGQKYSVSNYWNDPHHQDIFLSRSVYLPYIDNIIASDNSQLFKSNFEQLTKLVLIGGPDDGVITPWQSSQFAVFDDQERVVPMKKRSVFKDNLFGLQTLHDQDKMVIYTFPEIKHHQWHHNLKIIDNYIIPHLD